MSAAVFFFKRLTHGHDTSPHPLSSLISLSFASLSLTVHRILLTISPPRGSHAIVYRYAARAACDCCNQCLTLLRKVSYRSLCIFCVFYPELRFSSSSSSSPLPFQRITFAYHLQRPPWPSSATLKSHRCVYRERERERKTRERALWNVHPFSLQKRSRFPSLSLPFLCQPNAVFHLNDLYKRDTDSSKLNLGVGGTFSHCRVLFGGGQQSQRKATALRCLLSQTMTRIPSLSTPFHRLFFFFPTNNMQRSVTTRETPL